MAFLPSLNRDVPGPALGPEDTTQIRFLKELPLSWGHVRSKYTQLGAGDGSVGGAAGRTRGSGSGRMGQSGSGTELEAEASRSGASGDPVSAPGWIMRVCSLSSLEERKRGSR